MAWIMLSFFFAAAVAAPFKHFFSERAGDCAAVAAWFAWMLAPAFLS